MDEQFKSVILKAFKRIDQGKIQFGIVGISDGKLTSEPRFFRTEKNGIGCYQKDYLGFYVLRAAYHSICGSESIYFRIENDTVEIMSIIGRQDVDENLV